MSYCRFENTANDLSDCQDRLEELGSIEAAKEELSESEFRKMKRLIKMCQEIADSFSEELEEFED